MERLERLWERRQDCYIL